MNDRRTTITGLVAAFLYASTALSAIGGAPTWALVAGIVCAAIAHGLNSIAQADAKKALVADANPAGGAS